MFLKKYFKDSLLKNSIIVVGSIIAKIYTGNEPIDMVSKNINGSDIQNKSPI